MENKIQIIELTSKNSGIKFEIVFNPLKITSEYQAKHHPNIHDMTLFNQPVSIQDINGVKCIKINKYSMNNIKKELENLFKKKLNFDDIAIAILDDDFNKIQKIISERKIVMDIMLKEFMLIAEQQETYYKIISYVDYGDYTINDIKNIAKYRKPIPESDEKNDVIIQTWNLKEITQEQLTDWNNDTQNQEYRIIETEIATKWITIANQIETKKKETEKIEQEIREKETQKILEIKKITNLPDVIEIEMESKPHSNDLSTMLLNRPAPNTGAFLLYKRIPTDIFSKIKKQNACRYYNQDDLEEFDMFFSNPGWRYDLNALLLLLENDFKLYYKNILITTKTQLFNILNN